MSHKCNRKHAVETLHAILAPGVVGLEDDLGIAFGEKVVTHLHQFGAQFLVVVDRAVEYQRQLQVVIHHGLVRMCGQVNDGQPPVAECQRSAVEEPFVIRPAPRQLCRHALQRVHIGD